MPRALGDLGADVVKIEPPEGDPTRRMASFAGDEPGPERHLRSIPANRSVAIDMNAPEARDLVRALEELSDILVEDRTPGYMAGLGLGYKELREVNSALVSVSVTPFGQTGPHSGLSRRRPHNPLLATSKCDTLGALRDHELDGELVSTLRPLL